MSLGFSFFCSVCLNTSFKHISRVSVFFHFFALSEWRAFLFHNGSERKNTPIVRMNNVKSLKFVLKAVVWNLVWNEKCCSNEKYAFERQISPEKQILIINHCIWKANNNNGRNHNEPLISHNLISIFDRKKCIPWTVAFGSAWTSTTFFNLRLRLEPKKNAYIFWVTHERN